MKTLFVFIIGCGLAFTSFGGSTNQTAPQLYVRTYKVSTNTFVAHLRHLLPPKPSETDSELLFRYLKQKHIEIKPPENIFLNEKKGLLFVRATMSDQGKIEKIIEKIVARASGPTTGTLFTNGGGTWDLGAVSINGTNVPMSNITVKAIGQIPQDTNAKPK